MNWLTKLERKLGKYALPNLMTYLLAVYAAGFALSMINPSFFWNYLSLDAASILHGQVWRIVTFMLYPQSSNIFMLAILMYVYYNIGRQLEAIWGSFRFNVFIFGGILMHSVVAIIVYLITGLSLPNIDPMYLNMSLFLMFAVLFPDAQFMLYFAIPIKGKWIAVIDGLFFAYGILSPIFASGTSRLFAVGGSIAAIASLLNFAIFFLSSKYGAAYSPRQQKRKYEFKKKMKQAEKPIHYYENGARHKCAVCGRTELDSPDLEFRYCSKCNGNYEYCQDHLFTHTHVK